MKEVVIVDYEDRALGTMEKQSAHEKAALHRAFSVFLYHGESLLLQRRAKNKYHCGGLWTNTCCSHPGWAEDVADAGKRRLHEELGITVDSLHKLDEFIYYYAFDNGLTEYEYDHILVGEYDGECTPNPEEVCEVCWVDVEELKSDVMANPKKYTPWFIIALKRVDAYMKRGK